MKTFLTAWVAIIVLGWLLIGLVASVFGSVGLLILAAAVIAALVAVIAAQYQDIDDLQKRLEVLEEAAKTDHAVRPD